LLKIFFCAFTSYSGLIAPAQGHCSPQVLALWKLAHCMTYLSRRNRFYHSWSAVGRGVIHLKRNDWREMKQLNLFAALEHRRLALNTAA